MPESTLYAGSRLTPLLDVLLCAPRQLVHYYFVDDVRERAFDFLTQTHDMNKVILSTLRNVRSRAACPRTLYGG